MKRRRKRLAYLLLFLIAFNHFTCDISTAMTSSIRQSDITLFFVCIISVIQNGVDSEKLRETQYVDIVDFPKLNQKLINPIYTS